MEVVPSAGGAGTLAILLGWCVGQCNTLSEWCSQPFFASASCLHRRWTGAWHVAHKSRGHDNLHPGQAHGFDAELVDALDDRPIDEIDSKLLDVELPDEFVAELLLNLFCPWMSLEPF